MYQLDLSGEWTLKRKGGKERHPAQVPGCFHTDLLRAGVISDPFHRDNERQLLPLSRETWIYEREFTIDKSALTSGRATLVFEGLDTFASIEVNGKTIAKTENMFRRYEFPMDGRIKVGRNTIRVTFQSPLPTIERRHAECHLHSWGGPLEVPGRAYVRKMPCNFGWDWGPVLVTAGIWKPVRIEICNHARIADIHIAQHHNRGTVSLDISAKTTGPGKHRVRAEVTLGGEVVASAETESGASSLAVKLARPQFWWPAGIGDQPLYTVRVKLLDKSGQIVDATERRIGLRELKLDRHADKFGESFQFTCNGRPFFAKGANWIPADAFPTRLLESDYRAMLQAAHDANMNMIRVWGGGFYENDVFYDLCDEMGLCVWQDFMFACSMYPTFDAEWMENVREEARQQVTRIRHHACLALWCGNNEMEQGLVGDKWTATTMDWKEYGKLFDEILPSIVRELDPQRDYWPCSPHSPVGDRKDHRNEACGDAHLWDVWHSRQPFEWYRTTKHRFVSEFGFQSFPEPLTARSFTEPDDRHVASTVMEAHQRSGLGNTLIMNYLLDWFRIPTTFDNTLHVTQMLQALAIKYAVEHWRRMKPRTMGTLYWQLNDTWPGNSWSSIDYFKRWKGLHYFARKFYAPVLLSLVEDGSMRTVQCHLTNDLYSAVAGILEWQLITTSGARIASGSKAVKVPSNGSKLVHTINLAPLPADVGLQDIVLAASFESPAGAASSNLSHFERPKNLSLQDPEIRTSVKQIGAGGRIFHLALSSTRPALFVYAELGDIEAKWSDRYFHLMPGNCIELEVHVPSKLTTEEFIERLTVTSLYDTFEHPAIPSTPPAPPPARNGAGRRRKAVA